MAFPGETLRDIDLRAPLKDRIRADPEFFEKNITTLYGPFPEKISQLQTLKKAQETDPLFQKEPVRSLVSLYINLARDHHLNYLQHTPATIDAYYESLEAFLAFERKEYKIALLTRPAFRWGLTQDEVSFFIHKLNATWKPVA